MSGKKIQKALALSVFSVADNKLTINWRRRGRYADMENASAICWGKGAGEGVGKACGLCLNCFKWTANVFTKGR